MSDKEEETAVIEEVEIEKVDLPDLTAEEPSQRSIEEKREVAAKNLAYLIAIVFLMVILFPLGYFLFAN